MSAELLVGDCRVLMPSLGAASVDAIVTDPPYGLEFMGHGWDHGVPGEEFWRLALQVAKPGASLFAFGGTRTHHRLMVALEDAGWELRDVVSWLYGSGFPKSLNLGKAIDRAAGATPTPRTREETDLFGPREVPVQRGQPCGGLGVNAYQHWDKQQGNPDLEPVTEEAATWDGWGTALKPAWEPIILARKPLIGTVTENIAEHGAGALNIGACRIPVSGPADARDVGRVIQRNERSPQGQTSWGLDNTRSLAELKPGGRWPANVALDPAAAAQLDAQSGDCPGNLSAPSDCRTEGATAFDQMRGNRGWRGYDDRGGASRFFYCPKASRAEREEGLESIDARLFGQSGGAQKALADGAAIKRVRNHHPTVKPVALMRWLCRLITPPGGLVLDPFTGSGSTGVAAALEGFRFVGCELSEEYAAIARARLAHARAQPSLWEAVDG